MIEKADRGWGTQSESNVLEILCWTMGTWAARGLLSHDILKTDSSARRKGTTDVHACAPRNSWCRPGRGAVPCNSSHCTLGCVSTNERDERFYSSHFAICPEVTPITAELWSLFREHVIERSHCAEAFPVGLELNGTHGLAGQ